MDFVLYETQGATVFFPLTPERVTFTTGATIKSIVVLDRGTIEFPRGYEPMKISFGGIFPGPDRLNTIPSINATNWQGPTVLAQTLENWERRGTKLVFRVLQQGTYITPINVFITTFEWTHEFGFGDVYFKIALTESRDLIVMTQSEFAAGVPARPTQSPLTIPSSYVTKTGDSVWAIAQRFYGDGNWLYAIIAANRSSLPADFSNLPAGISLTLPGGVG